jgi:hypothetical protein
MPPQHGAGLVAAVGRSFFTLAWQNRTYQGGKMPSLLRFLTLLAVIGGLVYGGMFLLATKFDPKPREITVSVPPDRFAKQR